MQCTKNFHDTKNLHHLKNTRIRVYTETYINDGKRIEKQIISKSMSTILNLFPNH
jgi:hypothetical protein